MKTVSYTNASRTVEVLGFNGAGEVKILAAFGHDLETELTPQHQDACRAATAWIQGDDEAPEMQVVKYLSPGQTTHVNVYPAK